MPLEGIYMYSLEKGLLRKAVFILCSGLSRVTVGNTVYMYVRKLTHINIHRQCETYRDRYTFSYSVTCTIIKYHAKFYFVMFSL